MTVDANKALVLRFFDEVWSQGNVSFAEEVFAQDYVRHDLRPTNAAPGGAGQALIAEQFRHAFPDLEWRVDLVVGEDDLVAARWTATGTHTGPWGEVAPTGRRMTVSGVNIFRFGANGKVVELWNHRDDLGLRDQLDSSGTTVTTSGSGTSSTLRCSPERPKLRAAAARGLAALRRYVGNGRRALGGRPRDHVPPGRLSSVAFRSPTASNASAGSA